MPLSLEELITLCRRYYPAEVSPADDRYKDTAEIQSSTRQWDEALRHTDTWHRVHERLGRVFPDATLGDLTVPYHEGGWRLRIFPARQTTQAKATELDAVIGCVSVLAPVYFIYGARLELDPSLRVSKAHLLFGDLPEHMAAVANRMAMEFESLYPYARLPGELAHVKVPGIWVESFDAGEATLLHALFTPRPDTFY